jgi:hypothetical protein
MYHVKYRGCEDEDEGGEVKTWPFNHDSFFFHSVEN